MSEHSSGARSAGRFARPEWERRFLLDRFPEGVAVVGVRRIQDRYIKGTRLRLRRISDSDGAVAFKLTQKVGDSAEGAFQGQLTTIYLTEAEYNVIARLPASPVEKRRYSVPPFGIDVFDGDLRGLVLAEAEFSSGEAATVLALPVFLLREVTSDPRFTGGCLSVTTRERLVEILGEFGIELGL